MHVGELEVILYGLFWIEVLSIMEMVLIGAPSLRRVNPGPRGVQLSLAISKAWSDVV